MLKLIGRNRKPLKIIVWVATLLWMGMIFYFSSQPSDVSLNSSGKVLVSMDKLEKEEVQNISERRVWNLQNTIRKYAHFIVYSALGFLLALSFVLIWKRNYWVYLYSWFAASLYGVLDEFHQYFVPGRGATLSDMGLDMVSALLGTILGLGVITLWKLFLKKRNKKLSSPLYVHKIVFCKTFLEKVANNFSVVLHLHFPQFCKPYFPTLSDGKIDGLQT